MESTTSQRGERKRPRLAQEVSVEETREEARPDLDSLPTELLEIVLSYLPYHVIAGPVRLVSKRCAEVATEMLNSAFTRLGTRLRRAMAEAKALEAAAADGQERWLRVRAHDCLELALGQYELLRACCWRYTHPVVQTDFGRVCFYGGLILDKFNRLLGKARQKKDKLAPRISRSLGPSSGIDGLDQTCKSFMNHFEKVTESRVNRNSLVSGCKLVDLLDCLEKGKGTRNCRVIGQSEELVSMKLHYLMERSWFTCLRLPGAETNEDSWSEQQYFMYLRLRRLVGIANEHYFERLHYDRCAAAARASNLLPRPISPTMSLYTGYGECGGQFYYYGSLNDLAYQIKVIRDWRQNAIRDRRRRWMPPRRPSYNLAVSVYLKCSPELAPLSARSLFDSSKFDGQLVGSKQPQLHLKIKFNCPAAMASRLPSKFVWLVKTPSRRRSRRLRRLS